MYISEQPAGIGKDGIKTKRAANDTQKRNKKIRKLLSLKKVKKMETNEVEKGVSSTLKVSSITSVRRAQIRISEFEEKNASKFNCQNRWIGDNFIQRRFPIFFCVTSIENPLVSISELWWRSRHKHFHKRSLLIDQLSTLPQQYWHIMNRDHFTGRKLLWSWITMLYGQRTSRTDFPSLIENQGQNQTIISSSKICE